jgi:hypothetical protein
MGMYTTLHCRCKVKEEYENELFRILYFDNEWRKSTIPEISEFGKDERAFFISAILDDEEEHIWIFSADLKNYDNTLEHFIDIVLTKICEEIYELETEYEEDSSPSIYELLEREIVLVKMGERDY